VAPQADVPAVLAGRRVVLGVTGGIAAYKSVEVMRRLQDLGAHVSPVVTDAATNMIGLTTFEALGSEPPKTSLYSDVHPSPHTFLGQSADLILVAPATARIISDLRTGRSDDLLSATLLATEAPVVVAPAMHTEMWNHPATQDNIAVLIERGVTIVGPAIGRLAGGDEGSGRLEEPEVIVAAVIETLMANADLKGRKVVVSAGGTREALDPVRYIGNRSTGKQGHALAEEVFSRGANVVLVTTSSIVSHAGIRRIDVVSAADMAQAIKSEAEDADIVVMAAAVADFRPASVADRKIKKADGTPEIVLERTEDILASLGQSKRAGQVLVGFAAETNDVATNAKAKLAKKNADLIVANDVSAPGVGFGHETNAVTIHAADGSQTQVPLAQKSSIAKAVVDAAVHLLNM
jgi:phosphopantothenoylcysteine decarboxylase/phosphopantothenate--cysteine ligase